MRKPLMWSEDKWGGDDGVGFVAGILVNPFYAVEIAPVLAEPHEPMISEDQWVAANAALIGELGAEEWLRTLLAALKTPIGGKPCPSR